MKKRVLLFNLCVIIIFFFSHVCFAELYVSIKGLFKIDVPKGWEWLDNSDTVIISSVLQEGAIIIKIQTQSDAVNFQGHIDEFLDRGIGNMVQKVKEEKGVVVSQKQRTLDGLKARQVDFLLNSDEGKAHATFMAVFFKKYLFTIYMEGPDEAERAKMVKIIERIKFLGR